MRESVCEREREREKKADEKKIMWRENFRNMYATLPNIALHYTPDYKEVLHTTQHNTTHHNTTQHIMRR